MCSVPTIGEAGSASVPGTNAALSTGEEGVAADVRAATGNRSVAAPADTAAGSQAAIRQTATRRQDLKDVCMGRFYAFDVALY
jgi:hypothetical protein